MSGQARQRRVQAVVAALLLEWRKDPASTLAFRDGHCQLWTAHMGGEQVGYVRTLAAESKRWLVWLGQHLYHLDHDITTAAAAQAEFARLYFLTQKD